MTVCHSSPSGVGGRFIGTTGPTGDNSGGSGSTTCGAFLFHTFGIGVRVTTGDLDLLCRL